MGVPAPRRGHRHGSPESLNQILLRRSHSGHSPGPQRHRDPDGAPELGRQRDLIAVGDHFTWDIDGVVDIMNRSGQSPPPGSDVPAGPWAPPVLSGSATGDQVRVQPLNRGRAVRRGDAGLAGAHPDDERGGGPRPAPACAASFGSFSTRPSPVSPPVKSRAATAEGFAGQRGGGRSPASPKRAAPPRSSRPARGRDGADLRRPRPESRHRPPGRRSRRPSQASPRETTTARPERPDASQPRPPGRSPPVISAMSSPAARTHRCSS